MDLLTWAGIAVCLLHSATFSGLNLALFGLSRLRLEVEAEEGDADALKVIGFRRDSNFLLTTILWGNVAANCLLTLLTDSVMAGVWAFVFATFGITFFGEIIPQAWFSRNALKMGAGLAPVLGFYQKVLWPVARPTAWLLDRWLGREGITWLRERDLRRMISKHMEADDADLELVEGRGALNFLALDDLLLGKEGEPVDPASVITLPVKVDLPVIPECAPSHDEPFVQQVERSGHKWVILCGPDDTPLLVLDADEYLRGLFMRREGFDPYACCHRPLVVRDASTSVGRVLRRLRVHQHGPDDDVIDEDLILVWSGAERRVITGADLLGFLLRGIVPAAAAGSPPADLPPERRKEEDETPTGSGEP